MGVPSIQEQLVIAAQQCPDLLVIPRKGRPSRKPRNDYEELRETREEIARTVLKQWLEQLQFLFKE